MQRAAKRLTFKGFTLLELVICILLITLTSLVALGGLHALRAANSLREVVALRQFVEMVRSAALVQGVDKVIQVDKERVALRSGEDRWIAHTDLMWGACPGCFGPPANPIHPIAKHCTFSADQIICSASGALSAGTIYCSVPSKNQWYALTVSVGDVGPIRLYQYRNGRWMLL